MNSINIISSFFTKYYNVHLEVLLLFEFIKKIYNNNVCIYVSIYNSNQLTMLSDLFRVTSYILRQSLFMQVIKIVFHNNHIL